MESEDDECVAVKVQKANSQLFVFFLSFCFLSLLSNVQFVVDYLSFFHIPHSAAGWLLSIEYAINYLVSTTSCTRPLHGISL